MKNTAKFGRIFFCIALIGVGIQQLFYLDFCQMLFLQWPDPLKAFSVPAYLFNIALISACVNIVIGKGAGVVALTFRALLFAILLLAQIPYEYRYSDSL